MNKKIMWMLYRFKTRSVDDCRPLIFNPKYPWWCSGYSSDFAIIIAWLPEDEPLTKYWDDAFEIDSEQRSTIYFTERFPKPEYFVES